MLAWEIRTSQAKITYKKFHTVQSSVSHPQKSGFVLCYLKCPIINLNDSTNLKNICNVWLLLEGDFTMNQDLQ